MRRCASVPGMWPIDKLGVANQALALTGNNLVAAADDGSPEWGVCSAAYEVAFEFALDNHNWARATTVHDLTADPTAPADPAWSPAYAMPQDCVHIIWVRSSGTPVSYQILGNQIVANEPEGLQVKYVSSDLAETKMLRLFWTAIHKFILAGIYRGLHEDPGEAGIQERAAMGILDLAKTKADQEMPRRAVFNYQLSRARRSRRPGNISTLDEPHSGSS